ncbi:MBL fold metallo-hydrolase [Desulfallas thermosapovorans]|uniref:Metallo-beta-lactamase superfamily protein n=1 Tax=Desulfallas thermosapovorans DSM 6562 TaxID=1121431 RepID=A0A5S4ZXA2_9FIRM|nr:MBL fold metallo-hydrolase [Desulfallas thermosapovorans]TYO97313.1 metallo-beta-lactamase superfamily protein [Desulfallas thermosapovorans DSM 6562]
MRLTEQVTVLGNRHFHIYAVGAGPAVWLEGAVSAVVPTVAGQVQSGVAKGTVSHLVIMHAHFDHVCGIPGLRRLFPGARVAASATAREVLQRSRVVNHFFAEDAAMTRVLHNEGFLTGAPATAASSIDVDEVIEDGACWEIAPVVNLQFYHAPGHSPCSIVAYQPEGEVLFSSDCAGFPIDDKHLFPIFFESYEKYINTINRLADLPVRILAGAHEQIIQGPKQVREFWALARTEAERVREKIIVLLQRGLDEQAVAGQLFNHYYTGNLRIYSVQNIRLCCNLLVRRVKETFGVE